MNLTKKQLNLFEKVTQINAIAGHENELARFIKDYLEALDYQIITDNLGSVYGLKKSEIANAPRVMIDSHMDEVGFIVIDIKENGMIAIHPVGGWNPQVLLAHRVSMKTRFNTYLQGSIDAVPPHLMSDEDRFSITRISSMLVDFGFKSKEEAVNTGSYIGAMIVLDGPFKILNGGKRLLSKAFDNRYGVMLVLETAKYYANKKLPFDLYVGASVQEEVGLRGAQTITNVIKPDFAIVLDCSPARDSTNKKDEEGQLGGGILLRYTDRSMIANSRLIKFQEEMANKAKVKSQYYHSPGGTNAGAIHKELDGVLTLTHCIVARNIHTCSSIIDVEDYLAADKSLKMILKHLNAEKINKFKKL